MDKKQQAEQTTETEPSVINRVFSSSIHVTHEDDSTAVKVPVAAAAIGIYFVPALLPLTVAGGIVAKLAGKKININI